MRLLADETPGTNPVIELKCGALCNVQYDSLLNLGHLSYGSVLSSFISIVITIAIAVAVAYRLNHGRPGRLQALFEMFTEYVRNQVKDTTTEEGGFILPIAATIGLYILVANWLDILPISLFAPLHPANEDINQTLAMSLTVIVIVQWYSWKVLGPAGYFRRFMSKGTNLAMRIAFIPMNILEEIVKPITLAARLFFNIFAGGVMIYLITLLLGHLVIPLGSVQLPFGPLVLGPIVLAIWKLFDVLFIGAIQAFIFMLLTVIYFGMAREGLEEHH
jgi:F-type H+-transporting ATPase subunit a